MENPEPSNIVFRGPNGCISKFGLSTPATNVAPSRSRAVVRVANGLRENPLRPEDDVDQHERFVGGAHHEHLAWTLVVPVLVHALDERFQRQDAALELLEQVARAGLLREDVEHAVGRAVGVVGDPRVHPLPFCFGGLPRLASGLEDTGDAVDELDAGPALDDQRGEPSSAVVGPGERGLDDEPGTEVRDDAGEVVVVAVGPDVRRVERLEVDEQAFLFLAGTVEDAKPAARRQFHSRRYPLLPLKAGGRAVGAVARNYVTLSEWSGMQVFDVTTLVGVAAVAALLVCSAFFSGSEIAVFSLERHRLSALLQREDDEHVAPLRRLRENPHRLLVTILVGNTIVNVAMASIATAVIARLFDPTTGAVVSTVVMSGLILVFGEISPKSYGVANAESLSLSTARPHELVQKALYPVVFFFDFVSRGINRITGGGQDIERPYVTREEIEALLTTGERAGVIEEAEHEMVQGVFDLSSTSAREVMVPRVNVVGVDVETPLEEVLEICSTNRLTRLPVYEGTLERMVGIADIRDVERAAREGLSLRDVLLPTLQVPDSREIDNLLTEMQEKRVPMVVVRDEFGEMEGILTVEDILEEIVGEIFEVGEERFIRPTADGLLVKGEVTVGEINDFLDVSLPRESDFETVAGLINTELGRIGDVDDTVEVADVSLTVERVDGNRISRVRVERLEDAESGEGGDVDTDTETGA